MLAEAALIAAAKAILSATAVTGARAAGTAGLQRLRGDASERAVGAALRYALERLESTRPDVEGALFDEHFLTHRGAAVLARCLLPGERATPEDLVLEWSGQVPGAGKPYASERVHAAASDFLQWFAQGLRGQEATRAALDSRAVDAAADAAIENQAFLAGQRSRSLVDPQPLYRELGVDTFTGREWLVHELDGFLETHRAGASCSRVRRAWESRRSWPGWRASADTRSIS